MAAKKRTTRQNSAKKAAQTRAENKRNEERKSFLKKEITILVTLAISILLLLSNFELGGMIGEAVSEFLFGVFGLIAYIMPILLFLVVSFGVANSGNRLATVKLICSIVLGVMLILFLQLITYGYHSDITIAKCYELSSLRRNGGGFIGGCLVNLLCPAIGVVGTYVVAVIICIIALVIITEKSFIGGIERGSKKAYANAKKKKEQRREEQERDVEIPQRRKDRIVTGVSKDTTLKDTTLKDTSMDMHEVLLTEEEESGQMVISRAQPLTNEDKPVRPSKKVKKDKDEPIIENDTNNMEEDIRRHESKPKRRYQFPPLKLLQKGINAGGDSDDQLKENALILQRTLRDFNVNVTVTNISCGPSVTRYELQPEHGVKVSKVLSLTDDIKLNLAAPEVRIEAPIPGKAAIGIEVPNKSKSAVMLRDLLELDEFQNHKSKIAFATGRNLAGEAIISDIAEMPHVLIAGATGSGKSVCINTLIISILYKATPDEVKLILIDPKRVELSGYNGIPHLLLPVVTEPKKAASALNWAVMEMGRRYQLFEENFVRDLKGYNAKIDELSGVGEEDKPKKLPQIVVVVDELADLMMVAKQEVEQAICRLAQLARACGIHLILATQRPSVNVITGLIKANMPARIAFAVSSGVDSRTIIDMNGAEKLLGKGDMLFCPAGAGKKIRVQGALVTDSEVHAVVDFLKSHCDEVIYDEEITKHVDNNSSEGFAFGNTSKEDDKDAYFVEAGKFVIDKDRASIGMLQRYYKIGFNRAARIMDQLTEAGVVGGEEGTKPRKVLMSMEQFEQYIKENM